MPSKHTIPFKRFSPTSNDGGKQADIELDAYLPDGLDASISRPLKFILWVHTGGFLQGTRALIPPHLLSLVDTQKIAVIAPDFRLCPQVSIAEVSTDVADACNFVLEGKLSDVLSSSAQVKVQFSTSSWCLGGSSAGGWVPTLLGLGLYSFSPAFENVPKLASNPTSIFSIYPIQTISKADAPYFYEKLKPVPWLLSPTAKPGTLIADEAMRPFLKRDAEIVSSAPPLKAPERAPLYSYARQEGIYPQLVLPEGASAEDISVSSLLTKLSGDKVPHRPKSVYLAYGTGDVHVPPSQSELLSESLKAAGLEPAVDVFEGKAHLWDMAEDVTLPKLWETISKAFA